MATGILMYKKVTRINPNDKEAAPCGMPRRYWTAPST